MYEPEQTAEVTNINLGHFTILSGQSVKLCNSVFDRFLASRS